MKPELRLEKNGKYQIKNIDSLSYTYFPMTNFHAVKSVITPSLSGSMTIDQNTFLLPPTSNEDSHNSFLNRNVYFKVDNDYVWSITGNTPYQMLNKDSVTLEVDFLTHKVIRSNELFTVEIESFVPTVDRYQELHKITLKNKEDKLQLKPVVSIPLYSRSADNIRDHRHVTSLLNKAVIKENGLVNKPTFSFDERGHNLNERTYSVHTFSDLRIKNYWPILEEFIGEGGNLLQPRTVLENLENNYKENDVVSGYELTGGFEYHEVTLKPQEELTIYISLGIDLEETSITEEVYNELLKETKNTWKKELETLDITYKDDNYNGWLKWVSIQPIFRRIYGNSFLPHHDYGRGGRGWRDLWQDLLALILMNPTNVRESLLNNFKGVRIDGSNATIIGENPGEFLADRNNIARVWMDHGSWPLLTTKLYIDKMGDVDFLLEEISYFDDKFSHYTKQVYKDYENKDNQLKDSNNLIYKGTVLEHLIIQNLVPFHNVGKHNNIRLEDADWNDGLDMAHKEGESVAFTSMYADNLVVIADLLEQIKEFDIKTVSVIEELVTLLQSVDNKDIKEKHQVLQTYFDKVGHQVSGEKVTYDVSDLADILREKGEYLKSHVRENEWLEGENSWFNGYYDDDSNPLDNVETKDMTLTGQVFAVMCNVATDNQIKEIIQSSDKYLFDENVAGYKLNTDYNEVKTNMGRLFGFAYGHKENGAMFSHMAVMYSNGLYKRGFAKEGQKVLSTIYNHCIDISKSKMYPGIPEYVDPRGRGMYPFLTGSASWFILTEVTEVFGVKAELGSLVLEPKLLKEQFSNGVASIKTLINGLPKTIKYINNKELDFGEYKVATVTSEKELNTTPTAFGVKVLDKDFGDVIEVYLDEK